MPQQVYSSSDDEDYTGFIRVGSARRNRYRENVKRRPLRPKSYESPKIELIRHPSDVSTSEVDEEAKKQQNGNVEGAANVGNQANGDPVKPNIQEQPRAQSSSFQAHNGTNQHQGFNGTNQHQGLNGQQFFQEYNLLPNVRNPVIYGTSNQANLGSQAPFTHFQPQPTFSVPVYHIPPAPPLQASSQQFYSTQGFSQPPHPVPDQRYGKVIGSNGSYFTYHGGYNFNPSHGYNPPPQSRRENPHYSTNFGYRPKGAYYPSTSYMEHLQTTFPPTNGYQQTFGSQGNFQSAYGANASNQGSYMNYPTPPPPYENFQRPHTPGSQGNAQQAPETRKNPTYSPHASPRPASASQANAQQASNPRGNVQQSSGPQNPTQSTETRRNPTYSPHASPRPASASQANAQQAPGPQLNPTQGNETPRNPRQASESQKTAQQPSNPHGNGQQSSGLRGISQLAQNPGGNAQQPSTTRGSAQQPQRTRVFYPTRIFTGAAYRQNPTQPQQAPSSQGTAQQAPEVRQNPTQSRPSWSSLFANNPVTPQRPREPTPTRAFGPLNQYENDFDLQSALARGYESVPYRNFRNIAESSVSSSSSD